jgi:hypothetical protein
MQDSFVSEGVTLLQLKTPTFEESIDYFCETIPIKSTTVGVHQWWTFFIKKDVPVELSIFKDYLTLEIL